MYMVSKNQNLFFSHYAKRIQKNLSLQQIPGAKYLLIFPTKLNTYCVNTSQDILH